MCYQKLNVLSNVACAINTACAVRCCMCYQKLQLLFLMAVSALLDNFMFSNLPLLSESYNTDTGVK